MLTGGRQSTTVMPTNPEDARLLRRLERDKTETRGQSRRRRRWVHVFAVMKQWVLS